MTLTITQTVTQPTLTITQNTSDVVLQPVINTTNNSGLDFEVTRIIDGYTVDTVGNTNRNAIEVGNIISGVKNGRYIVAKVDALPYTDDNNLTFYTNNLGS